MFTCSTINASIEIPMFTCSTINASIENGCAASDACQLVTGETGQMMREDESSGCPVSNKH
jgi:hypothetical protein